MMRSSLLAACLLLTLVGCDRGDAPGNAPAPSDFSLDLIRIQEWEIYHRWSGRIPEVRARVVKPDGEPAAGATVSVMFLPQMRVLLPLITESKTTNEEGKVRFENVPGNAYIQVSYEGYAGGVADLQLMSIPEFGDPVLPMRRGAEITGRVLLADGTPVPAARILGVTSTHDWYGMARTDEEGRFRFPVAPAAAMVLTVMPGGPIGQSPPFTVPAGGIVEKNITARILPPIRGVVVHAATGKPIEGAVARSFVDEDVLVRTDVEGRFTLENVYAQMIQVFAPGYAEQWVPVDFYRTGEQQVEVKLGRGVTARGVVKDDQGQPIAGARVFGVVDVEEAGRRLRGPLTDQEGRFEWSWIEPEKAGGKIVFGAEGPGLLSVTGRGYPLRPGEHIDDVSLTLHGASSLTCRLVNDEGQPLAEVRCIAEPDLVAFPSGVRPVVRSGAAGVTGPDGRVELTGLRRGPHFITVEFDERLPYTTTMHIGPGGNDLGEITVPEFMAISGNVTSTGGELPDMVKAFLTIPGESFKAEVRIGKDGNFRIAGLEDRKYVLQVAATDHRTITREYPAGTEDLKIRLQLLGKLAITPFLSGADQPKGRIEMVRAGGADAPVIRYFNHPGETVHANRMTPGDWFVRVKAGNFYGLMQVSIEGGQSESVQVPLRPGGTILGNVRKPDGSPAPRIGVQYDAGEAWGVHGVPVADDGTYRLIEVPAGKVRLLTHPRGFVPFERSVRVEGGEEIREDIELDAGGWFELRVTNLAGDSLSGVKVSLTDEDGEPARYWISGRERAETDESGVLKLTGIPPGRYQLSLHIKDELWEARQVDIPAGESTTEVRIDR